MKKLTHNLHINFNFYNIYKYAYTSEIFPKKGFLRRKEFVAFVLPLTKKVKTQKSEWMKFSKKK